MFLFTSDSRDQGSATQISPFSPPRGAACGSPSFLCRRWLRSTPSA